MHHIADRLPGAGSSGSRPFGAHPKTLMVRACFRESRTPGTVRRVDQAPRANGRCAPRCGAVGAGRCSAEHGAGQRHWRASPCWHATPEGVEEDIYFFAAQVIELAEDDGCPFFVTSGALTAATASTESSNAVTPPFLMLRAFNATRAKRRACAVSVSPSRGGLAPPRFLACVVRGSSNVSRLRSDAIWATPT